MYRFTFFWLISMFNRIARMPACLCAMPSVQPTSPNVLDAQGSVENEARVTRLPAIRSHKGYTFSLFTPTDIFNLVPKLAIQI
jgi:hypothetical protein